MKIIKKIFSGLLAFSMLVGTGAPAFAAEVEEGATEHKTVITIHKVVMDKNSFNANKEGYNGGVLNVADHFGSGAKEVAGVAFDIYKELDENTAGVLEDTSILGALAAEGKFYKKVNEQALITSESGVDTSELGEGVYIIVENKEASTYKDQDGSLLAEAINQSIPVKIELPMTKPDGKGLFGTGDDKLHIYPKNTEEKPSVDKTVGDLENKYQSADVGKTITWYLQATAPTDIKDYKVFKMTDTFKETLTYKGNVVVKYGTGNDFGSYTALNENEDYTLTQPEVDSKGGDLTIKLTAAGIAKLKANDKVVASVDTVINEDAIMGLEIPNDFTLEYGHNPSSTVKKKPQEQPKVVTGGKRFKKTDGKEKTLEDAIFQLFDGSDAITWTADLLKANDAAINAGKFATATEDGEYTQTSVSNIPQVGQNIYLRSDSQGLFEIKGLEFLSWKKQKWDAEENKLVDVETITHDWRLKEVKAPAGYGKLQGDVKFTVDKTSYLKDPTQVELGEADPQVIENKENIMPQTGGIGTLIFVVAGIGLMAGALVAMKRRNSYQA